MKASKLPGQWQDSFQGSCLVQPMVHRTSQTLLPHLPEQNSYKAVAAPRRLQVEGDDTSKPGTHCGAGGHLWCFSFPGTLGSVRTAVPASRYCEPPSRGEDTEECGYSVLLEVTH